MLNLISIKVTGFRLLQDNFNIDLITKARVYDEDKSNEVIELNKGLNTFRSLAIVGSNSSGKTTVLALILKVLEFLKTGRWIYSPYDFSKNKIDLEVIFYLDHVLYKYKSTFENKKNSEMLNNNIFSTISNEQLVSLKYDKARGIKNLDIINNMPYEDNALFTSSFNDTSAIIKITKDHVYVDDFNTNVASTFDQVVVKNTFFSSLTLYNKDIVSSIIKLLDDSIEYITYKGNDQVLFKRYDEEEKLLSKMELILYLSSGTVRGLELYIRAIDALKYGKVLLVDEIEHCFQKNLVNNLIFLFNDSNINKNSAKLIFSTHYVELLDYLNRRDNIYITHKINGKVSVNNLYTDYNIRTELLKSKQFDNNVFNTSLNYQLLLEVRKALKNELQTNND